MRDFIKEFNEYSDKIKKVKNDLARLEKTHRRIAQDFLNEYFERLSFRARELYLVERHLIEQYGGYTSDWSTAIYLGMVFCRITEIHPDYIIVEDIDGCYDLDDGVTEWKIPFSIDVEKDKELLKKAKEDLIEFYKQAKEEKDKLEKDARYQQFLELKKEFLNEMFGEENE